MERMRLDSRDLILALAKNPTGLNEVLRTIAQSDPQLHLLVMLNDNIADGRDVSWIWDADVEMLAGQVRSAVFAGSRGEDMALRFKYGDVLNGAIWEIEAETDSALMRAVALTPEGSRLFVIPTYTAMLDVREKLTKLGVVANYWIE